MSARTNLAMLLPSIQETLELIAALTPTIGAINGWDVIEQLDIRHVASGEVRQAVQDGFLVIATTSKDPEVRMHLSREGQYFATTISFRKPPAEDFMRSLMSDLRDQFYFVAAASGEELEVQADAFGGYEFIGDHVEVL
ncbi:hypothetical protein K7B09_12120 [Thermomonas sp. RSS23]|uniref:Uncharacterized protein n=1 Tax=Thermomonas beijingensis TaxID=2872701 RepID=A0ABS7TGV0_9GAMM|nr:hypothetical protein [Thermomonas beijingensis]MBZ4187067.1 hypothetical protein [Thermomonas beijingensis]